MLVCISKLSSNCYQGIEIGYACTKEKAEQIAHAIFNRLTGMTQLARTKFNLGIEHCWKHPQVFALGCALCIALAFLVWKFWPTSSPPQNPTQSAKNASIPEISIKTDEKHADPKTPLETAPQTTGELSRGSGPITSPPQDLKTQSAKDASIPEITIKIAETKFEPDAPHETAPAKLEQTMVPPQGFGSTDTSLVEIASPPPVTCELHESDNKN